MEENYQQATDDKEMQEPLKVHHLIVLDESGSMFVLKDQTITGCNETLQTIRTFQQENSNEKHYVSIYFFDTDFLHSRYIIKNQPIESVNDIISRDYMPNGGTPLMDALGVTLKEIEQLLSADEKAMAYVTVITDGYENSSLHYSTEMIASAIDKLKEMGVVFKFIGANINVKDFATSIHIENTLTFEATLSGVTQMWETERDAQRTSIGRLRLARGRSFKREEFSKMENRGKFFQNEYQEKVTPNHITHLAPNEIFVFGSNPKGYHNGGAAGFAVAHFGAILGQPEGIQGNAYAIPTDGVSYASLANAVERFLQFTRLHPELIFYVTRIGCGNAGWTDERIAPLFIDALHLSNVKFPAKFLQIIK